MRLNRWKPWIYVALVGLGIIVGIWTGLVFLPWLQIQNSAVTTDREKFDVSVEVAKVLITAAGTVATIAAGVVLYLNFRVANRQAEIANRNAEIAEKSTRLAEERLRQDMEQAAETAKLNQARLVTERFSKAVEQLGHQNPLVRIGAIYSLERIAIDSISDHWTIMEVLSSFIKVSSPYLLRESKDLLSENQQSNVPRGFELQETEAVSTSFIQAVQAAATVIGRRKTENDPRDEQLNLSNVILQGLNLRRAALYRTNLYKASLSSADLTEADLSKAFLHKANLSRATVSGANLSEAILLEADLSEAKCWRANLSNAFLYKTTLRKADFSNASLYNSSFSEVTLSSVNLRQADLRQVNGLTPKVIKSALNWDKAIYDEDLRKQLGLSLNYDVKIRKELGLPPREGQE